VASTSTAIPFGWLSRRRLGLVPLLVLPAVAVAAQVFNAQFVSPSPLTVSVLNTIFISLVGFAVAWLAARAFYGSGLLQPLWLGSATLVWGFGNLLGAWLTPFEGGNTRVTACAAGALTAALLCMAGAVTAVAGISPLSRGSSRRTYLVSTYGGAVLSISLVLALSARGLIPPFSVAGTGDTPLRQVVLLSASALFAVGGLLLFSLYSRSRSSFVYWYSLGVLLLAVGLLVAAFSKMPGDLPAWLGRGGQYIGGTYLFLAIVGARREARAAGTSLEEVVARVFPESLASYRLLVETATDAIIAVNSEGRVLLWNPAAEKMFGYGQAEAIGRNLSGLTAPEGDADIFGGGICNSDADPISVGTRDMVLKRKDGQTMWAEVSISGKMTASGRLAALVMRDITERKRMEEELNRHRNLLEELVRERTEQIRQREAELRAVFEAVAEGIVLVSRSGRIIEANRAAAEMLQLSPHEPTDHQYAEVMLPWKMFRPDGTPVSAEERAMLSGLKECALKHVMLAREEPEGATQWLSTSAVPLTDEAGNITGVVSSYTDITPLKNAEDALRALSSRLLQIQEEERRAIARELHDEIGQSLTALKLSIDRAMQSQGGNVSSLEAMSAELQKLVERVRNLSLALRPSILDDIGLLETLLWHFQRYTAQTGVRVDFKHSGLDRALSSHISVAIFRVVQEALTNVARHARVYRVRVNVKATQTSISLSIEDKGVGFDLGAAVSGTSSGISGMRERVRLLDGEFAMKSAPGAGTQLRVTLPLARPLPGRNEAYDNDSPRG
jgi:PAS domain S-box-containing protein